MPRGRFTTRFMIHMGGRLDGRRPKSGKQRAWSRRTMFEVQFVHRLFHSEADITVGFDLGASQVSFDGRCVRLSPLACLSFAGHYMVVDTMHSSSTCEQRIVKYANRGFGVVFPFAKTSEGVVCDGEHDLKGMPLTYFKGYRVRMVAYAWSDPSWKSHRAASNVRNQVRIMLERPDKTESVDATLLRDYDDEFQRLLPNTAGVLSKACAIEHAVAYGGSGEVGAFTTSTGPPGRR